MKNINPLVVDQNTRWIHWFETNLQAYTARAVNMAQTSATTPNIAAVIANVLKGFFPISIYFREVLDNLLPGFGRSSKKSM